MPTPRPAIAVAVVMRRERIDGPMSRWQPWRWVLTDVVPQEDSFGLLPRLLYQNDDEERWLHPGFTVELFQDDAEGYYLNTSTDAPAWFVLWRMYEGDDADEGHVGPPARPVAVSLSYRDAGRWLDAQETVEQVPAPSGVVDWLRAYVAEHHVAEPKRRKRPESFRTLTDRFGNPASISTDKARGGGVGGGGHG